MASEPAPHTRSPESDPRSPPLAGTRSQTVQRLQVGLFGLAVMILLIGLANVIMSHARRNEDRSAVAPEAVAASQAAASTGNDPLADAGVVPDMPASSPAPASRARTPGQP